MKHFFKSIAYRKFPPVSSYHGLSNRLYISFSGFLFFVWSFTDHGNYKQFVWKERMDVEYK